MTRPPKPNRYLYVRCHKLNADEPVNLYAHESWIFTDLIYHPRSNGSNESEEYVMRLLREEQKPDIKTWDVLMFDKILFSDNKLDKVLKFQKEIEQAEDSSEAEESPESGSKNYESPETKG